MQDTTMHMIKSTQFILNTSCNLTIVFLLRLRIRRPQYGSSAWCLYLYGPSKISNLIITFYHLLHQLLHVIQPPLLHGVYLHDFNVEFLSWWSLQWNFSIVGVYVHINSSFVICESSVYDRVKTKLPDYLLAVWGRFQGSARFKILLFLWSERVEIAVLIFEGETWLTRLSTVWVKI